MPQLLKLCQYFKATPNEMFGIEKILSAKALKERLVRLEMKADFIIKNMQRKEGGK